MLVLGASVLYAVLFIFIRDWYYQQTPQPTNCPPAAISLRENGAGGQHGYYQQTPQPTNCPPAAISLRENGGGGQPLNSDCERNTGISTRIHHFEVGQLVRYPDLPAVYKVITVEERRIQVEKEMPEGAIVTLWLFDGSLNNLVLVEKTTMKDASDSLPPPHISITETENGSG